MAKVVVKVRKWGKAKADRWSPGCNMRRAQRGITISYQSHCFDSFLRTREPVWHTTGSSADDANSHNPSAPSPALNHSRKYPLSLPDAYQYSSYLTCYDIGQSKLKRVRKARCRVRGWCAFQSSKLDLGCRQSGGTGVSVCWV